MFLYYYIIKYTLQNWSKNSPVLLKYLSYEYVTFISLFDTMYELLKFFLMYLFILYSIYLFSYFYLFLFY